MLLGFVQSHSGEGRSVESDSGPEADDDGREQKFVQDGRVDGRQGPAVGPSQLSILLDPAGLDASVRDDKDGLLQSLFELSDELLVGSAEEDFVRSVGDVDKDEGFILVIGDLLNLVDEDGCGEPLVLCVEVVGSFDEGCSDLVFEV